MFKWSISCDKIKLVYSENRISKLPCLTFVLVELYNVSYYDLFKTRFVTNPTCVIFSYCTFIDFDILFFGRCFTKKKIMHKCETLFRDCSILACLCTHTILVCI